MAKLTKLQSSAVKKMLKKDGQLTTSGVLKEAEKESSPLHSLFEWDDSKAAIQYRNEQSRRLIKRYNITVEIPEERVVHIPSEKRGEGVYKETVIVVNNISEFELAMTEALAKLKAAESAVSHLHMVANKENPDSTGILAVAMKSISTASEALSKIH